MGSGSLVLAVNGEGLGAAQDEPGARSAAYRELGLRGFPTYILIGPDGKILENDNTTDGPSLRSFKLEVIRKYVLNLGKE